MKTYDFATQLRRGQGGEAALDAWFGRRFDIRPATRAEQRRGIDRWFTDRASGERLSIEYKTDWTASRTGNCFVETVSVDTADKAGWAVSSQAQWLVYFLPDDGLAYVIPLVSLRAELPRWRREYPVRRIPNDGYHTVGLLVPQDEFERLSGERTVQLRGDDDGC